MATIRPMQPVDRPFVVSTWSSSYRLSRYAGMLSMATYADVMHAEIERILDHPTTSTLVAEQAGETDHMGRPFLYGFACVRAGAPYVYYVYVKAPYRQGRKRHGLDRGYATQLLEATGIDLRQPFAYACETAYCAKLGHKIPLAEFDVLPARYLDHAPGERQGSAIKDTHPETP